MPTSAYGNAESVWKSRWRTIAFAAAAGTCGVGTAPARPGPSIDDLVGRSRIALATITPDGRRAAYLVVVGDPIHDDYKLTIREATLTRDGSQQTLAAYTLSPEETFNDVEMLLPTAGALRWISNNALVFVRADQHGAALVVWDAQSRRSRTLLHDHGTIELEPRVPEVDDLVVSVSDAVNWPIGRNRVKDRALLVRDDDQFYGPLRIPSLGRWLRTQKWIVRVGRSPEILPTGEITEESEIAPEEAGRWPNQWPAIIRESEDQLSIATSATPSPSGKVIARVEEAYENLRTPGKSYDTARIVITEGGVDRGLTPIARPYRRTRILGWNYDGRSLYYVEIGPESSSVYEVDMIGTIRKLYTSPGQLEAPGAEFGRQSDVLSSVSQHVLLNRSTNLVPDELIDLDLRSGAATVVDAPNQEFAHYESPEVRFYNIDAGIGDAWGRLYLPSGYVRGRQYPLVITQYYSLPGFDASTGDEVPILPLTEHGIAVFAMHSLELSQVSTTGNVQMEVSRLQRPMDGAEWITRKLIGEGIVDSHRVGLTGLSYGAQIAMYSLWKSKMFCAISVASAAEEPTVYVQAGPSQSSAFERRGFPRADATNLDPWRELWVGLNMNMALPPILFQSSDGEQAITLPTWFRLRHANKPVEWYVYPNEGHMKRSPANKWWIFQRNLDWFRFWLQDYEDPAPEKGEQYNRWRELRKVSEAARRATASY
jgi:dipeptidyl aminopeptidase/acylaminoacyl peptidase